MRFLAFVLFALASPAVASAQDTPPAPTQQPAPTQPPGAAGGKAKLDAKQLETLSMLHQVNMMEIEAGKLAERQGTPKVQDYGKMLVKDHQANDKQLATFARQHGLSKIPAYQPRSQAEQQAQQDMKDAMARLRELQGADFDRAFLNQMVLDHQKAIAKVDQAMSAAKDPAYAELLRTTRPVLQRHEDRARELQQEPPAVSRAPADAPQRPR